MASPPPSRLLFLSDLALLAPGEKVRFLGCVEEYQVSTGTLVLQHHYPSSSAIPTARVNIDHVLETLKSTEVLQVGAWVNVIGYVTAGEGEPPARSSRKAGDAPRQSHVQAIVLWSAGSLNLDEYEKAVEQRKALETNSAPLG
ncbi:uncharacterized protein BDZ99DRAFT_466946 [Mytilinidion resinicola]|uniref:CST complex subunit Ten1 n=1 Tax=Mytilinidion resinicola TaxID=574789 RepID=A0A6A6Y920_9PEZI|nr:uncharacterized protein BDZ99DRAFT_466946 [Mytilinidion resinicola]KAF2805312.1 hypothetical protein BDZ99DRAFT_466946 [Mytilinidion resinicola]